MITVTVTNTAISILALNWDGINWVSQLFLVIFAGMTLISGTVVNRRQARQLLELETKLAQTTETTSKAQESTAQAEVESAKLKILVSEAEQKRAQAERELLQFQEHLAARTISPEQRTRFVARLEYQPKGKVALSAVAAPNGEPRKFAEILKGLLADAGYDVPGEISSFAPNGSHESGIVIKVKDAASPPHHSGGIQKAFEAIEIKAPATVETTSSSLDPDTVVIYVYDQGAAGSPK